MFSYLNRIDWLAVRTEEDMPLRQAFVPYPAHEGGGERKGVLLRIERDGVCLGYSGVPREDVFMVLAAAGGQDDKARFRQLIQLPACHDSSRFVNIFANEPTSWGETLRVFGHGPLALNLSYEPTAPRDWVF